MKKVYLFLIALLISLCSVKAQNTNYSCVINFEDNPCSDGYYWQLNLPGINSIWSIGIPHNTVFDSAYSWSNAIFTDGGIYPVNNTSSFFISFSRQNFCMCQPVIGGWYKFDSDSLKDFGMIEYSLDHGTTWLNVLSDTVIPDEYWKTPKPVLTGRIHQWTEFMAYLQYNYNYDTITYRFTFISDSIETNQEGWMLDDIRLIVHTEGIDDVNSPDEINIYPNPASDRITISAKTLTGEMDVSVYDIIGQLTLLKRIKNQEDIDISGLGRGIYMVRVVGRNNYGVNKIVKE